MPPIRPQLKKGVGQYETIRESCHRLRKTRRCILANFGGPGLRAL